MKYKMVSMTVVAAYLVCLVEAVCGQTLKEVKIVYPSAIGSISLFTAQAQGFFENNGLRPVLLQVRSQVGIQAQVAGEVDYTLFGGGAGMTAAMRGFPIKIVMFLLRFANYALVSSPHIRSLQDMKQRQDMKQKQVGVSYLGGNIYRATRVMLTAGGLDPDKDVQIVPIGVEDVRLQALIAGRVEAVTLPVPLDAVAEEKGFNRLTDVTDKFEPPANGLTVSNSKLREQPNEVKTVIKVLLKGASYYVSHRKESIGLLINRLKMPRQIAEKTFDRSLQFISRDGFAKTIEIEKQIEAIREDAKIQKQVSVGEVVDFSLLRAIQKELQTILKQ